MTDAEVSTTERDALERSVRAALNDIGDIESLARNPLSAAHPWGDGGQPSGAGLRDFLLQAIEALDPPPALAAGDPSRRRGYVILRERYVERHLVTDICSRMAISETEFYRRHTRAIAALTRWVASRLDLAGGASGPPFVGREPEMNRLRMLFGDAAAGRGGRLVLISGAMGVGKTRLAQEAGRRAEAEGGRFLVARYLRDAGASYGPWVDALADPLDELTKTERVRLADPYARVLSQLFPSLQAGPPRPDLGLLSPEDRRLQLHRGLVGLLRGLGERQPLLLLCDDLQWAPGLGMLAYLATRLGEMRLLVLATVRQPEFDDRPELRRARHDLMRLPGTVAIDLSPLGEDDTVRLTMDALGPAVGAHLGPALHDRTLGNPFFIQEALRGWRGDDPRTIPLPESMQAAVLERAIRLGEPTASLLTRAAVLGEAFCADDIERLAEQPADAALEAAVDAGLLREQPGGYAFCDEHVREALYESVPRGRRARLHLAAAGALQAGGHVRVAEVAHHFASGGDAEAGARYSFEAGAQSAAAFDWEEAAFQYRRALALWEQLGGHALERAECCLRLGDLFFQSGVEVGQAAPSLQQALALFEEAGDVRAAARAHVLIGRNCVSGSDLGSRDMARGLQHLETAYAALERESPPDPLGLGLLFVELAGARTYALDVPAALASAARGVDLGRESGDLGLQVLAEGVHASLVACAGRPGQGLDVLERSRQAAVGAGLLWHADLLQTCQAFLDGILHPARVAQAASDLPKAASTPSRLALPQHVLGTCAGTGDFARGMAVRALVARTLADAGQPRFGPEPAHLIRFLTRRGDWDEADRVLADALDWTRRSGARAHEALILQASSELHTARGATEQAADAAGEAAFLDREGGFALGLIDALATLAQCLATAGRLSEAETTLAEARASIASPDDWGRLAATVVCAEGCVRRRQGRIAESDSAFAQALEIFRTEELRWDEAFTLDCWGRERGGEDAGWDLRQQAKALWVALGAGLYTELCGT